MPVANQTPCRISWSHPSGNKTQKFSVETVQAQPPVKADAQ